MAVLAIPLVSGLAATAMLPAGFTMLGMSAFGLGWAVGGMAASYLLAPDSEGPRLSDLAAGGSSYGTAIPLCYGTTKVPGNVIWASDLIEAEHTESAKGGPEYTSYTYSQHLAVMVCAGPVTGIRKIWANGKLILDASDTNTGKTGQSSNIRIYVGDETQVADSLLETYLGAGNVPAHRGYCYVVFDNLQLADYGNRAPSFEFEVVSLGDYSRPVPEVLFNGTTDSKFFVDTSNGFIHVVDKYVSRKIVKVYDVFSRSWVLTYNITSDAYQLWQGPGNTAFAWATGVTYQFERLTGSLIESWVTTGSEVGAYRPSTLSFVFTLSGSLYELKSGLPVALAASFTGTPSWQTVQIAGDMTVLYSEISQRIAVVSWVNEVVLFHATTVGGGGSGPISVTTYDSTRNKVYICSSDTKTIHVVDLTAMSVSSTYIASGNFAWPTYMPEMDVIAITSGGAKPTVSLVDPDTMSIIESWGPDPYWPASYLGAKIFQNKYNSDQGVMVGSTASSNMVATLVDFAERLGSGQVALSSIVGNLCERAGLDAADYDVSDLTDMVDGYKTT